MLESLHISIPGRHTATPVFPPSPSLRASSYKSSNGSIAPLRRSDSVASIIPETDSSLDNSLKGEPFKLAVVKILIKLKLTSWKLSEADNLVVKNIASALTNSVYLIVLDSQKLLLRIYGPNALHLIDRDYETSVLARLAHHRIGPRLLGQFKNGRVEQWLESVEVTAQEIREQQVSLYIARRMREFHDYVTLLPPEMDKVSATCNLDCWIPSLPEAQLTATIRTFIEHIELYTNHVKAQTGEVVFCHNDLQYGNLLRIRGDEHHCLAVIDFEYAGPNPRAFDLANHFIEWMANYHEEPAHTLEPSEYPCYDQSEAFLTEYIRFGKLIARREDPVVLPGEVEQLRASVDLWRAMSHAQWAIWGIIQALPQTESQIVQKAEAAAAAQADESRRLKTRKSSSSLRQHGARGAQSPLVQGMRSPFLPPATSPRVFGLSRTTSSHKSPGYFPTVPPAVAEAPEDQEDEEAFSLGESAVAALGRQHLHRHEGQRRDAAGKDDSEASHPICDDELEPRNGDAGSVEAEDWIDDDDEAGGFDYTAYAHQRIGLFYGEVLRMGLVSREQVPADVVVRSLPDSAHFPRGVAGNVDSS